MFIFRCTPDLPNLDDFFRNFCFVVVLWLFAAKANSKNQYSVAKLKWTSICRFSQWEITRVSMTNKPFAKELFTFSPLRATVPCVISY